VQAFAALAEVPLLRRHTSSDSALGC